MAKRDYKMLAGLILSNIGGKKNIAALMHCVTRLRVEVQDKSLIKDDEVKKIPGVIGTNWLGDQYQIIIGQEVVEYYKAVCNAADMEVKAGIDENLDKDMTSKKFNIKQLGSMILAYLSPTMLNLLPLIVAVSLMKTVSYLLGPDVLKVISADGDLYVVLNLMYNAFFYFLPVFLGYTAAKAINLNPIYGLYLGTLLLVPDFVNLVGVQDTLKVFGIPCPVAGYSNSFLPVVLGVWVCSWVYKLFNRIVPKYFQTLLVPLLTIAVMTPIMFGVCAPVGTYIGNAVGMFFVYMAKGNIIMRLIGSILLAIALPFMVLTGTHGPLFSFALMIMAENSVETLILPIMFTYNYGVFGVALGAFLKLKDPGEKKAALEYFLTCILGGITEPILYGIVMKYKKTWAALLVSGVICGIYIGIFAPGMYLFTTVSVLGSWAQYVEGGMANFIMGCLSLVLAVVSGAVAAYMVKYDEKKVAAK